MLSLTGLTYRNVKENIAREPVYFFTMILIEASHDKRVLNICDEKIVIECNSK